MPYIRTQVIGANKIVVSFEPPSFDPVESRKVIDPLLVQCDEYIELDNLKTQYAAIEAQKKAIWADWQTQNRNSSEWAASEKLWNAAIGEGMKLQTMMRAQVDKVEHCRRELLENVGVRFEVVGAETVDQATWDDLVEKMKLLNEGERLLDDGTVVVDQVGTKYWTKPTDTWIETEITELGDTVPASGAFLHEDLTTAQLVEIADQRELDRIAALTTEEKDQEKQAMIDQAARDAGALKSQYEIENRLDPLGDAQAWYAAKVAEIDAKYT
jgi:uncharacterized protein YqgV (UPF0045/DUF77 family)